MEAVSLGDGDSAVRVVLMRGGQADAVIALPGNVNRVFRISGPDTDWVVRYPIDGQRSNEFPTEVWAPRRASGQGIPVAPVVAIGELEGRPYLVLKYVAPNAAHVQGGTWQWLGRYAARLAMVPLDDAPTGVFSRFGRDLRSAWRAHLQYNLDALSSQDPLLDDGVYPREGRDRLRVLIEQLMLVDFRHGLAHGDLAPRNLVPRRSPLPPILLDWGTATTGPAPWTDIQRVFAWTRYDRLVDELALAQFAEGAGVGLDKQATTGLEQMSAVRFLDLARWARERRPDLYREQCGSSRLALATILGRFDRSP